MCNWFLEKKTHYMNFCPNIANVTVKFQVEIFNKIYNKKRKEKKNSVPVFIGIKKYSDSTEMTKGRTQSNFIHYCIIVKSKISYKFPNAQTKLNFHKIPINRN